MDFKKLMESGGAVEGGGELPASELPVTEPAPADSELDQEPAASYTSHPTKNMRMGRFQFENSTLNLKGDDVAEFEKLLAAQPAFIKIGIKKIDHGAANRLAKQYLDQNRMIQGIDNAGNGPTRTVGSSI